MTTTFLSKQNDNEPIKLLRAFSVAYTNAKKRENGISIVYLFLALVYPIFYVVSNDPETKLLLFQVSLFITVIVQIFAPFFKTTTIKGALIQEEFDTYLFEMPWKVTYKKVDPFEVSRLSVTYNGDEIKDWYPTNFSDTTPKQIIIAICQRSNTAYDIEVRKKYSVWLLVFLIVYSICLLLTVFLSNTGGNTFFFICFSIISFYTHFVSIWRGQRNVIEKLNSLNSKLDNFIFNKIEPKTQELRDIQDEIFLARQESAKVPNMLFRLWKKELDKSFDDLMSRINKKYNR